MTRDDQPPPGMGCFQSTFLVGPHWTGKRPSGTTACPVCPRQSRQSPPWCIPPLEPYNKSIELNRKRLAHILGVRDPRVPFDAPELVGTTAQPALVGRGKGYEVFAVRWPAFGDVHGEGLLLVPTGKKVADVVAIPDAYQTPEALV